MRMCTNVARACVMTSLVQRAVLASTAWRERELRGVEAVWLRVPAGQARLRCACACACVSQGLRCARACACVRVCRRDEACASVCVCVAGIEACACVCVCACVSQG